MEKCENCEKEHDGLYGSGRFCGSICARGFSTKSKRKEISEKVSRTIKKKIKDGQTWGLLDKTKIPWNKGRNWKRLIVKDPRICKNCQQEFVPKTEKQKFCSRSCTHKWLMDAAQVDWSKIQKDAYANGKNYVAGGTSKWYTVTTSNGDIRVQGTYEKRACAIFDSWKQNGVIQNWEYTNDRFKYVAEDGSEHTYLIDFKIYDNENSFYYVEVKGYEKENDKRKWNAVIEEGYKIEIWFLDAIEKYEMDLR